MIVLFPLLMSKSVSPNIIPGICKTLEKFILIYKLDSVLETINAAGIAAQGIQIAATAATVLAKKVEEGESLFQNHEELFLKDENTNDFKSLFINHEEFVNNLENYNLFPNHMSILSEISKSDQEFFNNFDNDPKKVKSYIYGIEKSLKDRENDIKYQQSQIEKLKNYKNTNSVEKAAIDREKLRLDDEKAKLEKAKEFLKLLDSKTDAKVDLEFHSQTSINIEPTYVTASTRKGTRIIGIKVVPFEINTDSNILKMMNTDLRLKGFEKLVNKHFRKGASLFYKMANKFKLPKLSGGVINDDPEKAILFSSTQHGKNIFLLLNKSDIENNIELNPNTVSNLFGMGWSSLIVADDINKRATFCMKEFNGMCSSVAYDFLYVSISRDAHRVYANLEDVRKSASPFFKMSVNGRNLFKK